MEDSMVSKRSLIAMLSIAACLLVSSWISVAAQEGTPPTSEECPTTSVEENIALVERLYAAVNSADAEAIDEILADDYTHNADRFGLPDDPTTNEDEIQLAMMLQQFYPGSTEVVRDIFGAGDKVAVDTVRTITEHALAGETTTLETPIEFRTIGILTIECGEVVNLNAMANTLELLVGLGAIELPPIGPVATPEA
jgi:ketosteroid isomerase-like protein